MAKKKVDKVEEVPETFDVNKAIGKLLGQDVLTNSRAMVHRERQIIPFSPQLDYGLNGGVPEGSWMIFTGPEKFGKTTLALDFAASCQKPENGGRKIWYLDVESRLKDMNIHGIEGLNLEPEFWQPICSTPGNILSAQDFYNVSRTIATDCPNSVIIFDSFSELATKSELEDAKLEKSERGARQKLESQWIRSMGSLVNMNNIIIIGITHQIANTSGFGASIVEKTSNSLKYHADIKLKATKKIPISGDKVVGYGVNKEGKKEAIYNQIGQITNWEVLFSALGGPGKIVHTYITYGKGIDKIAETLVLAKDLAILFEGGAGWYTFYKDGAEVKKQGYGKAVAFLQENPDVLKNLQQEIKEAM